ncbi:flagellar basal body L-ring protein FlgH [Candidatus Sneabacter namystus]|uniref:Flagellar basal body L-ring protein FlgH n=1 Tax=Candidatus Sneabacter namystus TaxID=2601646 RepID=A0A5C0UJK9_9RICK|nr:flagellar basal body L-ring protein FlgH [Candidatus Sneabacter namystus]QEK39662.1 hypothetical protein FZC37_01805 [Candidatus Sneabacter namystus]
MYIKKNVYLVLLLLLSGCSSKNSNNTINFSKMNLENIVSDDKKEGDVRSKKNTASLNSLWHGKCRNFLQDTSNVSVGSVIKVVVKFDESAKLESSTDKQKKTELQDPLLNIFGGLLDGVQAFKGSNVGGAFKNITNKRSYQGGGKVKRMESVKFSIASVVRKILPNGLLLIEGSQEVRINYEIRRLYVTGLVKPSDISADGTVESDKIAEARISYGGRGFIDEVQH